MLLRGPQCRDEPPGSLGEKERTAGTSLYPASSPQSQDGAFWMEDQENRPRQPQVCFPTSVSPARNQGRKVMVEPQDGLRRARLQE